MKGLLKVPKTPKGVETLNKILSAATQLFYERGYYGANVGDITKLAGVATGTFYVYFDSKISLYRFLLSQFGHSIRRELSQKTRSCKTRREAEKAGLMAWLEYVKEHPYVYNIIWESLYIDRRLFTEYYETFNKAYVSGLRASHDTGELADIDYDILSYALMGISNFVGLKFCMFNDEDVDFKYVTSEVMKVLEHGMFTDYIPDDNRPNVEAPQSMTFNVELDFQFLKQEDNLTEE